MTAHARRLIFATLLNALNFSSSATELSQGEVEGRTLVAEILAQKPSEHSTNIAILAIRDKNHKLTQAAVQVNVIVNGTGWKTTYLFNGKSTYGLNLSEPSRVPAEYFEIIHASGQPNRYKKHFLGSHIVFGNSITTNTSHAFEGQMLTENEIFIPFGKSDFWLCDLGLEFLHWPAQKVLPKTTNLKRGREYTLLESTNPNPSAGGYTRVLSWIDKESGGILEAEAFDAKGKLLKVFAPKEFKKVNGQWQLQEMEIRNVQTGSRTRLEFDLKGR